MKIKKKCQNCGKIFNAQMITTKYCCHKCNVQHYKIRKKIELQQPKLQVKKIDKIPFDEKFKKIQIQEYLSIKDVILLMGISRSTVYRLLKNGNLKSGKLGSRVLIRKKDLDKFVKDQINSPIPIEIKSNPNSNRNKNSYFYTNEIPDYYNISIRTLDRNLKANNIKKYRDGQETFVLRKDVEKIFGKPVKTPKK